MPCTLGLAPDFLANVCGGCCGTEAAGHGSECPVPLALLLTAVIASCRSTKDPGQQPFEYQAGVGAVITGWDQVGAVCVERAKCPYPLRNALNSRNMVCVAA